MTVKSDLKKAIANSESLRGTYIVMAESTEDNVAKDMFNNLKTDLDRHIAFLNNRLDYINLNNDLNKE